MEQNIIFPVISEGKLLVYKFFINLDNYLFTIQELKDKYSVIANIRGRETKFLTLANFPLCLSDISNGEVLWWNNSSEQNIEAINSEDKPNNWRFSQRKVGGEFYGKIDTDVRFFPYLTSVLNKTINSGFISLIDIYNYIVCTLNLGEENYIADTISYNRKLEKLKTEANNDSRMRAKYICSKNLTPKVNIMKFNRTDLEKKIDGPEILKLRQRLLGLIGDPVEIEEFNLIDGELFLASSIGQERYNQLRDYFEYGRLNSDLILRIGKILNGEMVSTKQYKLAKPK
jgi:hypothetical protein